MLLPKRKGEMNLDMSSEEPVDPKAPEWDALFPPDKQFVDIISTEPTNGSECVIMVDASKDCVISADTLWNHVKSTGKVTNPFTLCPLTESEKVRVETVRKQKLTDALNAFSDQKEREDNLENIKDLLWKEPLLFAEYLSSALENRVRARFCTHNNQYAHAGGYLANAKNNLLNSIRNSIFYASDIVLELQERCISVIQRSAIDAEDAHWVVNDIRQCVERIRGNNKGPKYTLVESAELLMLVEADISGVTDSAVLEKYVHSQHLLNILQTSYSSSDEDEDEEW